MKEKQRKENRIFERRLTQIKKISLFIVFSLCIFLSSANGEMFSGQASMYATYSDEWQTGIRYMPELHLSHSLGGTKLIDTDISFDLFTYLSSDSFSQIGNNLKLEPYRLWLRYSVKQLEIRVGLQQISFGPAKILRSLMWFNYLDPQDPLQITNGVYAGLIRYYFLNNANIWLWSLYGNDSLKGLETFKTDKNTPELGGRYQFPVPKGEGAFSFNHRNIDTTDWRIKMLTPMTDGLENRFAIDGNWDLGIGLWLEASTGDIQVSDNQSFWQDFSTIGTDYTFKIGPGVHTLLEHFIGTSRTKINDMNNTKNFSALSVDFSINTLDKFNIIEYYDWQAKQVYSFLDLQRTYDNWKINLLGFLSEDNTISAFRGNGVQLMVIYNH